MRLWNKPALRARDLRDDRGSASLEFLGVGMLVLLTIAYGMLTLASVEKAMLASELAARNSARVLSTQAVFDDARLASAHIAMAFENHDIPVDEADVVVTCEPHPDCAVAGDTVSVSVRISVGLPFVPGSDRWLSIPVESTATFPRGLTSPADGSLR